MIREPIWRVRGASLGLNWRIMSTVTWYFCAIPERVSPGLTTWILNCISGTRCRRQGVLHRLLVLLWHLEHVLVGGGRGHGEIELSVAGGKHLEGDTGLAGKKAQVHARLQRNPGPVGRRVPSDGKTVAAGIAENARDGKELRHERRRFPGQGPLSPQRPEVRARARVPPDDTGQASDSTVICGQGEVPVPELAEVLFQLFQRCIGGAHEIPPLVHPLVHTQAVGGRRVAHQLPQPRGAPGRNRVRAGIPTPRRAGSEAHGAAPCPRRPPQSRRGSGCSWQGHPGASPCAGQGDPRRTLQ